MFSSRAANTCASWVPDTLVCLVTPNWCISAVDSASTSESPIGASESESLPEPEDSVSLASLLSLDSLSLSEDG